MKVNELESELEAAADKLGAVMSKLGPDQKRILRILKDEAEKFTEKVLSEKKQHVDKAALFVVAITMDDNLRSFKDLQVAAEYYLDTDAKYATALMEQFKAKLK